MAALAAAAFLLIGVGLPLARVSGRFAGLLLLACATEVLLLVIVALLGYFYMVAPLTGVLERRQVSCSNLSDDAPSRLKKWRQIETCCACWS